MRKFANLLKKEIRELINKQLVISLVFMVALFSMMGGLAKTEAKKAAATQKISLLDLDSSDLSRNVTNQLGSMNFKID